MLARLLEPKVDIAYTFLRVMAGLLFEFHGVQKIFGVLTNIQPPVGTQLWFGGVIELTTGTLIALGAFTHQAAFLASGTMAVAYLQFHWRFHFGARFFPVVNQGEPALLYSVLFLYMACQGGGRWSIDARLRPPPSAYEES